MEKMTMEQADKLTLTDYLPKCPEKETEEFKKRMGGMPMSLS